MLRDIKTDGSGRIRHWMGEEWYRLPRGGGRGRRYLREEAPGSDPKDPTHWYLNTEEKWRAAKVSEVRKAKPPRGWVNPRE